MAVSSLEGVIDNYLAALPGDEAELELRFGKEKYPTNIPDRKRTIRLTRTDFDNVNRWLTSTGYKAASDSYYSLRVQPQVTSVEALEEKSDVRLEIDGFAAIQDYCSNEDPSLLLKANNSEGSESRYDDVRRFMRFVRKQKRIRASDTDSPTATETPQSQIAGSGYIDTVHAMPAYNCRLALALETELTFDDPLVGQYIRDWSSILKTYRYIRRISYKKDKLPFRVDVSVVKQSNFRRKTYTMRDSRVLEQYEDYEIEVEFDNAECSAKGLDAAALRKYVQGAIKDVCSGMQTSPYPIPLPEQFDVLKQYTGLLFGDTAANRAKSDRVSPKLFLSPGFVSLQMRNVVDNPDYIANYASIRQGYTVTDKADGLHKLLFVTASRRVYLIDTNMSVQFTGLVMDDDRLQGTVLDGEHIVHGKASNYINLFLIFDVLYANGVDVREFPLYVESGSPTDAIEKLDAANVPVSARIFDVGDNRSRLYYMKKCDEHIASRARSIVPNGRKMLNIQRKTYMIPTSQIDIFGCSKEMLGLSASKEYYVDGLIYTPIALGLGASRVDEKITHKVKRTWELMFKWKPIEDLTIDFMITTKKDAQDQDIVYTRFDSDSYRQYKCLELRVGYNERTDGIMNPYEVMLSGEGLPTQETSDWDDGEFGFGEMFAQPQPQPDANPRLNANAPDDYKPALFYPDNPADPHAHVCNVEVKEDANGAMVMRSEEGDVVEDGTIVECRYNKTKEAGWNWEIVRVRHDKTTELRNGSKQFGNAYRGANANWHIIHYPITSEMISTGVGIPTEVDDSDDVYYATVQNETQTRALRDFHNRYVKSNLIKRVARPSQTLIDFSVGQGGDLAKWQSARLSFVFGMDIHADGIKNRLRGASARYLRDMARTKTAHAPAARRGDRDQTHVDCLFIPADTSKSIRGGLATFDEDTNRVVRCVFGAEKGEGVVGRGVSRHYGRLAAGADVGSIQFAIHYMFETPDKLRGFARNAAECIKTGGYLIGTCFDGARIFSLFKKEGTKKGESFVLQRSGRKIWEVTRHYDDSVAEFHADERSIGLAIDVFQDTIGQTFREYLVNFEYLTDVLDSYGFSPMPQNELDAIRFPNAIGSFEDLFEQMTRARGADQNSNYGDAKKMSNEEKMISFSNNYFIFKKTREVSLPAPSAEGPTPTSSTSPSSGKKKRTKQEQQ